VKYNNIEKILVFYFISLISLLKIYYINVILLYYVVMNILTFFKVFLHDNFTHQNTVILILFTLNCLIFRIITFMLSVLIYSKYTVTQYKKI